MLRPSFELITPINGFKWLTGVITPLMALYKLINGSEGL